MCWVVKGKNTYLKNKAGFLWGDTFTKFRQCRWPPSHLQSVWLRAASVLWAKPPQEHMNITFCSSMVTCFKIKVTTQMQTQPEKNLNIMREARSSRMLPGMAGQAASANRGCLWSRYLGRRWAVAELRHSEASSPEHYCHKIVIYWGCNHTFIWLYRYVLRQAGQALPEESVRYFVDKNSLCKWQSDKRLWNTYGDNWVSVSFTVWKKSQVEFPLSSLLWFPKKK